MTENAMGKNRAKKVLQTIGTILFYLLITPFIFFGIVGPPLTEWYEDTFHTTFRELIYTVDMGLEGADAEFLKEAVQRSRKELLIFVCIMIILLFVDVFCVRRIIQKKTVDIFGYKKGRMTRPLYRLAILMMAGLFAYPSVMHTNQLLEFTGFIKSRIVKTTIYEEQYVDPDKTEIKSGENRKNLILVYLESMEMAYASEDEGGTQKQNLMPNLIGLSKENISFGGPSDNGGLRCTTGSTWTTGAIVATSSGVPFSFRVGMNKMNEEEHFGSGLSTLGDFLEKEGYAQEFLCGSNATFGGRRKFYEEHGNYQIYDYLTAKENGDIPEDYKVWWGFEDYKLFDIARKEATRLANEDEPFNLTLLTVDTHPVGGYVCKHCPDTYDVPAENIVACSDKLTFDFVKWCQQQDFYKDTVIVLVGDHPRMDQYIVEDIDPSYIRSVYNCFIGADLNKDVKRKREATTLDLFPTILSAMGYKISGDKLGLGTNLFSEKKTLTEKMGFNALNDELHHNSEYYLEHFE